MEPFIALKHSKLLIIGAGAIGGVTAAVLRRSGFDVTLVCKHPDLAQTISSRGIRLSGIHGVFEQVIPAVAKISDLQDHFRLVLIATKANEMVEAARGILPYIDRESLVVSMQNGICEDTLAEIVGRDRLVGCVVGWGATMHEHGWVEMTSKGRFVIGPLPGEDLKELHALRDLLSHVVPTIVTDNIYGHLYAKLIINACITSLGAVSGLELGSMLARKRARDLFISVMHEGMQVARAMNLDVEVYAGKLDYGKFLRGTGWWANLKRHLFIRIMGLKYRKLKSSSLQSLERGLKTEIDYLNGYMVNQAKQYGIRIPLNEAITEMVKSIERGEMDIRPENLEKLTIQMK